MKYKLFLIDLDDTLLDFQASEKLCFRETFIHFGVNDSIDSIHQTYKTENNKLWAQVEKGEIDKDFLKVERFKRTLHQHSIEIPPHKMADFYLSQLPKNVVLIDGAIELCKHLSTLGIIGILSNGIEETQRARIKNSELKNYVHFTAVSEECGFAKPDIRFFQYALTRTQPFEKDSILMIGDRLEADILGASNFGIDSIWFNPHNISHSGKINPTHTIKNLSEINKLLV